MAQVLRQSTASQEILLGPFVDSTDGDTAETGLTIANTDIKLFKHGGTTLTDKNSGGATHISNGYYYAVLDATDTDTVGNLEVHVKVAGALAVNREFIVVEEAVYDAIYASGATVAVNVTQINSSANAAARLALSAGVIIPGTVDTTAFSATTTEIEADDITEATADHYNGRVILWTSGNLIGQATSITDYSLATGRGHFTVVAMTEAPANNDTFIIV